MNSLTRPNCNLLISSSSSSSSLFSISLKIISSNPPKAIWLLFLTWIVSLSLSPSIFILLIFSSFLSDVICKLISFESGLLSKNEFSGFFWVLSFCSSISLAFSSSFISNNPCSFPPKLISFILSTTISPPSWFILISDCTLNSIPFCVGVKLLFFSPSIFSSAFLEISNSFFSFVSSASSLSSCSASSSILSSPYIVFIIFWGEKLFCFFSLVNLSFNFEDVWNCFFPSILNDTFLE